MIGERIKQVVYDRKQRMRMAEVSYWDERTKKREGGARSAWHAANFNTVWHNRQMQLLEEVLEQQLDTMSGKQIMEVGCGTGRISRHLHQRNANVTGLDYSTVAIEAAQSEGADCGPCELQFVVGDITNPPLDFVDHCFDVVLSVGCLAVACRGIDCLQCALSEMVRVTKTDGLVVLFEPIHANPLFGRVLREPVGQWIIAAQHAGLRLIDSKPMGFLPVRVALSSIDLPPWIVDPAFSIGEKALASKVLSPLGDYTMLVFRATKQSRCAS